MYKFYRDEFNKPGISDTYSAALFIFLNKCGFNGMYRENSKGIFNVPWGHKDTVKIFDSSNIEYCHNILSEGIVTLNTGSFEDTIYYAGRSTFYYLDPPYVPISKTSAFTSYTAEGFTLESQCQLKSFCDDITSNEGKFMMSNSYSPEILELYNGYNIHEVNARRSINSKGDKRGPVKEVLITNY